MPDLPADARAVAAALSAAVEAAVPRLLARESAEAVRRPAPGRWAPVEILGHLVDSAANNLQRVVRARADGPNAFPGYDQDAWVERQRYREADWAEVVALWTAANRHLARVVAALPADVLAATARVGDGPPVTVAWLAADYLAHLRHHLRQLGA